VFLINLILVIFQGRGTQLKDIPNGMFNCLM